MTELVLIAEWLSENNLADARGTTLGRSRDADSNCWDLFFYTPALRREDVLFLVGEAHRPFEELFGSGQAMASFHTPEGVFFTITLSNYPGFPTVLDYIDAAQRVDEELLQESDEWTDRDPDAA